MHRCFRALNRTNKMKHHCFLKKQHVDRWGSSLYTTLTCRFVPSRFKRCRPAGSRVERFPAVGWTGHLLGYNVNLCFFSIPILYLNQFPGADSRHRPLQTANGVITRRWVCGGRQQWNNNINERSDGIPSHYVIRSKRFFHSTSMNAGVTSVLLSFLNRNRLRWMTDIMCSCTRQGEGTRFGRSAETRGLFWLLLLCCSRQVPRYTFCALNPTFRVLHFRCWLLSGSRQKMTPQDRWWRWTGWMRMTMVYYTMSCGKCAHDLLF